MDIDNACEVPSYLTSDKSSFAFVSASQRWPIIITGAIDDVHRTVLEAENETKIDEGKTIIEYLAKLKYEVQHNKNLTPLEEAGQPDISGYNKQLAELGSPTWMNAPCLFAACYLYRRIHTYFSKTKHWNTYDVFSRQKISSLKSLRPAILELAASYQNLIRQVKHDPGRKITAEEEENDQRILFTEIFGICLWGNAYDLSFFTCLVYKDIQKLQGAEARKSTEASILANDLPAVFENLWQAQKQHKGERRIDVILDKAGFELFADLVLAGYLLESGLATQVVLHPKNIPWFVSDAIPTDFSRLLSILARPQEFFQSNTAEGETQWPFTKAELDQLSLLFEQWSMLHSNGQLIVRPNAFWTTSYSYWDLPVQAPTLFEDLKGSELVIFKGDLHYRKLTADAKWPITTPFSAAIGPFGNGSGIRTLALRTCKSDTVVGLREGEDERLRLNEDNGDVGARSWAWSGKYAVVQFCDGRTREIG